MEKAEGQWSISLDVYCPYCDELIDVMDEKESGIEPEARPWVDDELHAEDIGLEIECYKCKRVFVLDSTTY